MEKTENTKILLALRDVAILVVGITQYSPFNKNLPRVRDDEAICSHIAQLMNWDIYIPKCDPKTASKRTLSEMNLKVIFESFCDRICARELRYESLWIFIAGHGRDGRLMLSDSTTVPINVFKEYVRNRLANIGRPLIPIIWWLDICDGPMGDKNRTLQKPKSKLHRNKFVIATEFGNKDYFEELDRYIALLRANGIDKVSQNTMDIDIRGCRQGGYTIDYSLTRSLKDAILHIVDDKWCHNTEPNAAWRMKYSMNEEAGKIILDIN